MIYAQFLPARILKLLSVSAEAMTSTEITTALNAEPEMPLTLRARVVDTLPALVTSGKVWRDGPRKQYRYRLPDAGIGPVPAESEMQIAQVGADREERRAIMRAHEANRDPDDVVAAVVDIHARRAAMIDAQFAALRADDEPVNPVRCEEPD